jgi:hypothetical protein
MASHMYEVVKILAKSRDAYCASIEDALVFQWNRFSLTILPFLYVPHCEFIQVHIMPLFVCILSSIDTILP